MGKSKPKPQFWWDFAGTVVPTYVGCHAQNLTAWTYSVEETINLKHQHMHLYFSFRWTAQKNNLRISIIPSFIILDYLPDNSVCGKKLKFYPTNLYHLAKQSPRFIPLVREPNPKSCYFCASHKNSVPFRRGWNCITSQLCLQRYMHAS